MSAQMGAGAEGAGPAGGAAPASIPGPSFLDKFLGSGVGKAMGPVGFGMDAASMAMAPQQQAMAAAKAGSMAGHQKNQALAWQSPEYQEWARQLWGGA